MRHRSLPLVLVGAMTASLLAAVATPAHANITVNEVYGVPSGGVFPIEGHGWGHGHGMSQYGSRGGAQLGKTGLQITQQYYPGTLQGALANVTMRVKLTADTDSRTEVYPASGLVVRDLASGVAATLPAGPTRWRTVVDSAGLHLQSFSSGAWHPYSLPGRPNLVGPVQFGGPAAIRVALPDGTSRDYRGTVRAVKLSTTTASTVDVLPMESYLRGVVPRESPSSWALEALKAQAIAARSYSEYKREHVAAGQYYDICDTTACQVFGGSNLYSSTGVKTPLEAASTDQAVSQTAGVIRTYQGAAIFAEFSASNGGWSTTGSVPYLIAQRDDWDGVLASTVHSWRATVSAAQIQARYPAVGTLLRMRVTERDGNGEWGGRVKVVVLEGRDSAGAATSVQTTGAGIYNAHTWPAYSDGLKSSWWHVLPALNASVVSQSVAPRLVQTPGVSTGKLTVTLKNTGTVTWSTTGLHLAVSSPPGQADPLVGNSTRPGTYTGTATSIAPDATAAFSFALTGDGVSPGLYARSYRLRNGSGALYGPNVSWRIQVDAPTYVATPVSGPTGPGPVTNPNSGAAGPVLADGHTVVVPAAGSLALSYVLRNASNVAWPVSASGPVRLGTAGPINRSSVSSGPSWLVSGTRPSAVSASSSTVPPGQNGRFGLTLYGNNRPLGPTIESFQPLWEGRKWITGADSTIRIVRVDPGQSRAATVENAPPAKVSLTNAINGTASLVIRLRNVGASSWAVGSERLSAAASPLASGWPSATQAPALSRNATRPTVTAVYPGEVGEWRVPISAFKKAAGTYPLSFRAATPASVAYGPTLRSSVTVTQAVFTGSLVRTAGVVRVPRSGTALTSFDLKNTGNVTWPVGGRLRTESLVSSSPSYHSSWLSPTRPSALTLNVSRPGATDIRPGEVARFRFVLAGNGRTPRTTSEQFGAVWDGWTRMGGSRTTISYQIV